MQLPSDESTRRLPRWFFAALSICIGARIVFAFYPSPPAGGGIALWQPNSPIASHSGPKPLFLFLDNQSKQTAADSERLFGDPKITSLLNSSFSAQRINSSEAADLQAVGKDLLPMQAKSAIIVFGRDGKPASQVATFIPRQSLLQLMRQVLVSERK